MLLDRGVSSLVRRVERPGAMSRGRKPQKVQDWIEVRRRHRLSHAHVQMARELGMNPKELGKLDNHGQERWKLSPSRPSSNSSMRSASASPVRMPLSPSRSKPGSSGGGGKSDARQDGPAQKRNRDSGYSVRNARRIRVSTFFRPASRGSARSATAAVTGILCPRQPRMS